ncbi:MAG: hypothetical protein ACI828_002585, partial [Flavobacteriales bacterium]
MKSYFKSFSILFLFGVLSLNSCRSEDEEIITTPEQEALIANSTAANLFLQTSMNDGSIDNLLDNANCFTVQLPVTVFVEGLEIIVDDPSDFDTIEDLFDEDDDDIDDLDFQYPITIILNDFTEVVINNEDELEDYADQCEGENEEDDDIECIDFQYPISFSIFDQSNELIDTVTVNSDLELYTFVAGLDGDTIVSINFPLTLILSDGSTVVVNDIAAFEEAIENAADDCDEDDDNDHDDDDCENCTVDGTQNTLINCAFWSVDKLKLDGTQQDEQYEGFHFVFNLDGSLFVEHMTDTFDGSWDVTTD